MTGSRRFAVAVLLPLLGCSSGAADTEPARSPEVAQTQRAPERPSGERQAAREPARAAATPEPAPDAGAEADAAAAPPAVAPEPPPLPAGTRVLHIGDSFAAALGVALNRRLAEQGIKGTLRYETASFIPGWAGGHKVTMHVAQTEPHLVLVTLGANEVGMADPSVRAPRIKTLVEKIGDRPCVWIATPLWGQHTGIMDVIRENCAPCVYLDTNALYDVKNMGRHTDGIHPSMPAREEWADFVLEWLRTHRAPTPERPWEIRPDPAP